MSQKRLQAQVRIQVSAESMMGKILQYLQEEDHDLKQEFEIFLRAKYLPFVLHRLGETEATLDNAHQSVGIFMGMIEAIQGLCLIQRRKPTHPETMASQTQSLESLWGNDGHTVDARIDAATRLFGE